MTSPHQSPHETVLDLDITSSQSAEAHHRHQSSLEAVLDFSSPQPLEQDQRQKATEIFNQIVAEYEPSQIIDKPYKQITLFRTTYDLVISKDSFLRYFFVFIERELSQGVDVSESILSQALSRYINLDSWSEQQKTELGTSLATFSDHLFNNFFLPLKASTLKTPQPTPDFHSRDQDSEIVIGTTYRLSKLRAHCLIRDHHRCVISHKFNRNEAEKRFKQDGLNAKDNDGQLLTHETKGFISLEVAHILPHSLTAYGKDKQLSESKKTAIEILNMFDPGIVHLINGLGIDRSINALTLTHEFHLLFGGFYISFEPIANQPQHIYKIDHVEVSRPPHLREPGLPIIHKLYLDPNHVVDPPSSRLLAIHSAIGRILALSDAGASIDSILHDMDEIVIKADGSTNLEQYVTLKLGGWLDGVPVC